MKKIVIGSRGSELALCQSHLVAEALRARQPGIEIEIEVIKSKGDVIQDVPIAQIGSKGVFTKELESALLSGRIDLAVHSLKDLPTELPEGLCVAAIPPREDPSDALISRGAVPLEALPQGARVGTSSLRRKVQLLAHRPDLRISDLRGNVPTRLKKLETEPLDAIILAAAGLCRLGLDSAITQTIPPEIMLNAAGQGALGLEARADRPELLELLSLLNDPATAAEATAERALLNALGGGCQTPLGALGRVDGKVLRLRACVCSPDGSQVFRTEVSGGLDEATALGQEAAKQLLRAGAAAFISPDLEQEASSKPLAGKTIVITRAQDQADGLAKALSGLGAALQEFPMIEIHPVDPSAEIGGPSDYDWLVFTSVNGVECFAQALEKKDRALSAFREVAVCAVGPATAQACLDRGLPVTLTPERFVGEALLAALEALETSLQGKRFLLPRGDKARPMLPDALRARGAAPTELVVYENIAVTPSADGLESLLTAEPDLITFTSSSTVTNFCRALSPAQRDRLLARARVATIGPVTSGAARESGIDVAIEPSQHDIPGLVEAIVQHFAETP